MLCWDCCLKASWHLFFITQIPNSICRCIKGGKAFLDLSLWEIPKAKEITPRTAGAAEWKELFFSSLKIRAKLWGHYFPNFNQDFNTKKINYVRRKMHSGALLAGRVSDSARSKPAAGHSTTNALTAPDIKKNALQCSPPASRSSYSA